ncbi:MAG: NADH-quinone oxidoreductase subunit NuoF [Chloroflexi bacterium]|nr:NADH-quinone oxidoreductase subunit NuoF [Chloroflexota bacterium]
MSVINYKSNQIFPPPPPSGDPTYQYILLKHRVVPGLRKLAVYQKEGGYEGLKKALNDYQPGQVIDLVKQSGLRGRGGAGFPAGTKWSFIPKVGGAKYVCCNADESEPGTFSNHELIENNPHQLIEGILITCYAIGSELGFIYIRGEFARGARVLEEAVKEARAAGLVGKNILGTGFNCEVIVHRGAGAYICGEESALLESLEGKRGFPRLRPPFPAIAGLYARPTVINNSETLCNVPHILRHGPEWYANYGTEKTKGFRLYCLSGHVERPGNYELPCGTTFRKLIYDLAGGVWKGRKLKALIPGGSSTPFLAATDEVLDTPMDFEGIAARGSMQGSAGVIVFDDQTCIVGAVLRLVEFYKDESCGKCTPCREGTQWLVQILHRLEHGEGRPGDLELLLNVGSNIAGKSFCLLGDSAPVPIESALKLFREEFEYHIHQGRCMVGPGANRPVTIGAAH